ncbi:RIC1-domain-containing protein [Gymnopilus junonius]|uniref:RIC1-domain-containing protein n=1 Tax=Gymnopilus junonius TaxID=109634 RepID=A0A9P5TT95_GYMJU|nr:RIC1-domain-containing protein [Gymnopilus junonius]
MYFPTTAARQLACNPALPNIPSEPVVALASSPRKLLFCTLTRSVIAIWSGRPCALLSLLTRTPTSILNHGDNLQVWWSPDGNRIVIRTSESYLVLVSVVFNVDETVYTASPLPSNAQRNFLAGPGEGLPFHSISLHFEGVVRVEGGLMSMSPRRQHMVFSTRDPPTIQRMPWPVDDDDGNDISGEDRPTLTYDTWLLNDLDFSWLVESDVYVARISHSKAVDGEIWITSDGRVYLVALHDSSRGPEKMAADNDKKRRWVEPDEMTSDPTRAYEEPKRATCVSVNTRFSLIAIGTHGSVNIFVPNPFNKKTGQVTALEWTSDGYVLAVGWKKGWGIFSVGGKCLVSAVGIQDSVDEHKFQDIFMYGIKSLFWSPGNFELFVLADSTISHKRDGQLFVIPFAKSATTGQYSPDNTRYAFLQMDDRALIYRGADQPDLSVINPESDVWQHIKIPQRYLALNWPIRYSSLSSDGRLIAIAGRRGLIHYSSTSGRWKVFADEEQEQSFSVRGGLLWFHHVLVAAVEVAKSYQIRLYSRDLELSGQNVLHRETLSAPVIILSIVDNSLLMASDEVKYDIQVLADRIEFCWIHLRGVGALENSLWAYDAQGMRVWLNALSLESSTSISADPDVKDVKESVNIPLDFYPLSVLMDKGIIIGVEHETAIRSNLPFVMFRHATSSQLFLQHILLYHLENLQVREAVAFASHYKNLVYFAHALEMLLHTVVESDLAAASDGVDESSHDILSTIIEFLDHFDASLDVVVNCARKTEPTGWRHLFDVVGNPKGLFEKCLASKRLKTAASYLLVLHNLEQLDENSTEAIRLLISAVEGKDWQLCRELLRFLHSIDDTGQALRNALSQVDLVHVLVNMKQWKILLALFFVFFVASVLLCLVVNEVVIIPTETLFLFISLFVLVLTVNSKLNVFDAIFVLFIINFGFHLCIHFLFRVRFTFEVLLYMILRFSFIRLRRSQRSRGCGGPKFDLVKNHVQTTTERQQTLMQAESCCQCRMQAREPSNKVGNLSDN